MAEFRLNRLNLFLLAHTAKTAAENTCSPIGAPSSGQIIAKTSYIFTFKIDHVVNIDDVVAIKLHNANFVAVN
jgi:hypothetical protein